jgi:hypothetical protein
MTTCLAQSNAAWAEDTALLRSNRSADPGAKTGGGIKRLRSIPPVSKALRDWHHSEKPSRQDAAKSPTGGHLQLTNTNPSRFRFPLNQDTTNIRSAGSRFSASWVAAVSAWCFKRTTPS